MYLSRIRIVEAPSEKCAKCNWWLLLGEIREQLNIKLMGKRMATDRILSLFSQAAHKVCKEHWDGKR
jgi:hypothetical protein